MLLKSCHLENLWRISSKPFGDLQYVLQANSFYDRILTKPTLSENFFLLINGKFNCSWTVLDKFNLGSHRILHRNLYLFWKGGHSGSAPLASSQGAPPTASWNLLKSPDIGWILLGRQARLHLIWSRSGLCDGLPLSHSVPANSRSRPGLLGSVLFAPA